VRQWVLSVPKRLRYFMQRDEAVLGMVLRIFLRAFVGRGLIGQADAKDMLGYQHSGFSVDAGVCIEAHDRAALVPPPRTHRRNRPRNSSCRPSLPSRARAHLGWWCRRATRSHPRHPNVHRRTTCGRC
jgi:hypothetical protein